MDITKKAHKVNVYIGIGLSIFIGIQAFFIMSFQDALVDFSQAMLVGVLLFGIYKLPMIKDEVKAILFSMIPCIVLLAIMVFDEGYALNMHYIIFMTVIMIGIYFNSRLLVIYSGIYNAAWIIFYRINPEAVIGEGTGVGDFILILAIANGALTLMYFMTKWGNTLIQEAKDKEALMKVAYEQDRSVRSQIHVVTSELNTQINALSQHIEETVKGTNRIDSSMKELSVGVEHQTCSIIEISNEMNQTESKMNETETLSGEILKHTENVSQRARLGISKMEEMTSQMHTIEDVVVTSSDTVNELGKKIEQVTEILKNIATIAEQSNLLALNAAIEAARAGEEGRGFAVVAHEVRKLAESTGDLVKDITKVMHELLEKTQSAVAETAKGTQAVGQGTAVIGEVSQYFTELAGDVEETQIAMVKQTKIIEDLDRIFVKVHQEIEVVVSIFEEQTAVSEEVSTSTTKQSKDISYIEEAVGAINKLSQEMSIISQGK